MTSDRLGFVEVEATAAPIASLHGVSVSYRTAGQTVNALVDITLDIAAEATTALSGPSGSGKSTLLRLLGLFDRPNW